jgi:hypothetical protein
MSSDRLEDNELQECFATIALRERRGCQYEFQLGPYGRSNLSAKRAALGFEFLNAVTAHPQTLFHTQSKGNESDSSTKKTT